MSNATLPLPEPGAPVRSPHARARAARRSLRLHQAQWLALAIGLGASWVVDVLPPVLNPVLAMLGLVLAVRGFRRARGERADLLRSRGRAPEGDLLAAVSWRADPRVPIAASFRRAANWWVAAGAASGVDLIVWLR